MLLKIVKVLYNLKNDLEISKTYLQHSFKYWTHLKPTCTAFCTTLSYFIYLTYFRTHFRRLTVVWFNLLDCKFMLMACEKKNLEAERKNFATKDAQSREVEEFKYETTFNSFFSVNIKPPRPSFGFGLALGLAK